MKIQVVSCDRCGAHNAKEYKLAGPHGRATRDLCDDHAELALDTFREPKQETDMENRLRARLEQKDNSLHVLAERLEQVKGYANNVLEKARHEETAVVLREVIQLAVGSKGVRATSYKPLREVAGE